MFLYVSSKFLNKDGMGPKTVTVYRTEHKPWNLGELCSQPVTNIDIMIPRTTSPYCPPSHSAVPVPSSSEPTDRDENQTTRRRTGIRRNLPGSTG